MTGRACLMLRRADETPTQSRCCSTALLVTTSRASEQHHVRSIANRYDYVGSEDRGIRTELLAKSRSGRRKDPLLGMFNLYASHQCGLFCPFVDAHVSSRRDHG